MTDSNTQYGPDDLADMLEGAATRIRDALNGWQSDENWDALMPMVSAGVRLVGDIEDAIISDAGHDPHAEHRFGTFELLGVR